MVTQCLLTYYVKLYLTKLKTDQFNLVIHMTIKGIWNSFFAMFLLGVWCLGVHFSI